MKASSGDTGLYSKYLFDITYNKYIYEQIFAQIFLSALINKERKRKRKKIEKEIRAGTNWVPILSLLLEDAHSL